MRGLTPIVSRLRNGLRIATVHRGGGGATASLFVASGSRHEARPGAAHFAEHMLFKGVGRLSRDALERSVEGMGAHLNAYTAREQTCLWTSSHARALPECLGILADMAGGRRVTQGAVENEKHTILREWEAVSGEAEEVVFDNLHAAAFRDHAIGRPILGEPSEIEAMKRDDVLAYLDGRWVVGNMVLVVVGPFEHRDVVSLVEKAFVGLREGTGEPAKDERLVSEDDVAKGAVPTPPANHLLQRADDVPRFTGSEHLIRDDESGPEAALAVAWQAPPAGSADGPALLLAAQMMGEAPTGAASAVPLRAALHGKVAAYAPFYNAYSDTGLWGVFLKTPETAVEHSVGEALFAAVSLCYNADDELLALAKNRLKTLLHQGVQTGPQIAEEVGRSLLQNDKSDLFAKIDETTAMDVQKIANKYFHDQDIVISAKGPLHGLPPYAELRRQTFWLRY